MILEHLAQRDDLRHSGKSDGWIRLVRRSRGTESFCPVDADQTFPSASVAEKLSIHNQNP